MNWTELIGKKIVALRGWKSTSELSYILFDDKETFIQFNEQDAYSYHDCSSAARELELQKDPERWEEMFEEKGMFTKLRDDLHYPF